MLGVQYSSLMRSRYRVLVLVVSSLQDRPPYKTVLPTKPSSPQNRPPYKTVLPTKPSPLQNRPTYKTVFPTKPSPLRNVGGVEVELRRFPKFRGHIVC